MSTNLVNRKNYKTIEIPQDKATQTSNLIEDKIMKIIEIFISCCCPMPQVTKQEKCIKNPIKQTTKQPTRVSKKEKILREIDENFSDSSVDSEEWVDVDSTLIV